VKDPVSESHSGNHGYHRDWFGRGTYPISWLRSNLSTLSVTINSLLYVTLEMFLLLLCPGGVAREYCGLSSYDREVASNVVNTAVYWYSVFTTLALKEKSI